MVPAPPAVVGAPASEAVLRAFELEATPSAEAQQDSNALMASLGNPQQFGGRRPAACRAHRLPRRLSTTRLRAPRHPRCAQSS
jgi:hypothetical protein